MPTRAIVSRFPRARVAATPHPRSGFPAPVVRSLFHVCQGLVALSLLCVVRANSNYYYQPSPVFRFAMSTQVVSTDTYQQTNPRERAPSRARSHAVKKETHGSGCRRSILKELFYGLARFHCEPGLTLDVTGRLSHALRQRRPITKVESFPHKSERQNFRQNVWKRKNG